MADCGCMKGGMKSGMKDNSKGIIFSGKLLQLTDRQKDVLLLMAEDNTISISGIADRIGINKSAIQKHIEKLKIKGILKRVGPAKGGFWKIIDDDEKHS